MYTPTHIQTSFETSQAPRPHLQAPQSIRLATPTSQLIAATLALQRHLQTIPPWNHRPSRQTQTNSRASSTMHQSDQPRLLAHALRLTFPPLRPRQFRNEHYHTQRRHTSSCHANGPFRECHRRQTSCRNALAAAVVPTRCSTGRLTQTILSAKSWHK
jgi:hypothetical protein